MKGLSSKRIALKVDVKGPENNTVCKRVLGSFRLDILQAGGSEGVNIGFRERVLALCHSSSTGVTAGKHTVLAVSLDGVIPDKPAAVVCSPKAQSDQPAFACNTVALICLCDTVSICLVALNPTPLKPSKDPRLPFFVLSITQKRFVLGKHTHARTHTPLVQRYTGSTDVHRACSEKKPVCSGTTA